MVPRLVVTLTMRPQHRSTMSGTTALAKASGVASHSGYANAGAEQPFDQRAADTARRPGHDRHPRCVAHAFLPFRLSAIQTVIARIATQSGPTDRARRTWRVGRAKFGARPNLQLCPAATPEPGRPVRTGRCR